MNISIHLSPLFNQYTSLLCSINTPLSSVQSIHLSPLFNQYTSLLRSISTPLSLFHEYTSLLCSIALAFFIYYTGSLLPSSSFEICASLFLFSFALPSFLNVSLIILVGINFKKIDFTLLIFFSIFSIFFSIFT